MNKFWIETLEDGRILRFLSAPETVEPPSLNNGTMVEINLAIDPGQYAYFDGVLTDIGIGPENHKFDYGLREWVDPRSLANFKDLKWAEIKTKRTELEFGTFEYNGMVFDGDLDAQRRLMAYVSVAKSAIAAETPFSAEFILANNSVVTLTAEDFVGIELAKVQAVATAFAQATAYRAQIEAAITLEELQGIVWN